MYDLNIKIQISGTFNHALSAINTEKKLEASKTTFIKSVPNQHLDHAQQTEQIQQLISIA